MTRTLAEKIERRLLATLDIPEWQGVKGSVWEGTLPNGYEITWADGYAEPGYPKCEIVLLSNWNDYDYDPATRKYHDMTASRLADSLGKLDGVEIDWSDEYAVCDECNRAFRTVADSYSWTMYGGWNGDGYSCGDCIKEYPESYIEEYINESDKAITVLGARELELAGWVKFENESSYSGDYHSGWYGREDDPSTIMDSIHESGLTDVVFVIEGTGQFETAFAPYVRAQEVIDVFGPFKSLLDSAQQTVDYLATQ